MAVKSSQVSSGLRIVEFVTFSHLSPVAPTGSVCGLERLYWCWLVGLFAPGLAAMAYRDKGLAGQVSMRVVHVLLCASVCAHMGLPVCVSHRSRFAPVWKAAAPYAHEFASQVIASRLRAGARPYTGYSQAR